MATNLTSDKVPESWKPIPPEHMAKYYLLAIDQLAMVQKTMVDLALVQLTPVPRNTITQIAGCIAGLERVEMWLKGYRK